MDIATMGSDPSDNDGRSIDQTVRMRTGDAISTIDRDVTSNSLGLRQAPAACPREQLARLHPRPLRAAAGSHCLTNISREDRLSVLVHEPVASGYFLGRLGDMLAEAIELCDDPALLGQGTQSEGKTLEPIKVYTIDGRA